MFSLVACKQSTPHCATRLNHACRFSARDQTHSYSKSGHGLCPMLRLLAPTLQELCIAHCSDIFHAKSFADLAVLKVWWRQQRHAVWFLAVGGGPVCTRQLAVGSTDAPGTAQQANLHHLPHACSTSWRAASCMLPLLLCKAKP